MKTIVIARHTTFRKWCAFHRLDVSQYANVHDEVTAVSYLPGMGSVETEAIMLHDCDAIAVEILQARGFKLMALEFDTPHSAFESPVLKP